MGLGLGSDVPSGRQGRDPSWGFAGCAPSPTLPDSEGARTRDHSVFRCPGFGRSVCSPPGAEQLLGTRNNAHPAPSVLLSLEVEADKKIILVSCAKP